MGTLVNGTGTTWVRVTGRSGGASSGVTAVTLNGTVVDGWDENGYGFVTVYPCGAVPDASNLNFSGGQAIPKSVVAPLLKEARWRSVSIGAVNETPISCRRVISSVTQRPIPRWRATGCEHGLRDGSGVDQQMGDLRYHVGSAGPPTGPQPCGGRTIERVASEGSRTCPRRRALLCEPC